MQTKWNFVKISCLMAGTLIGAVITSTATQTANTLERESSDLHNCGTVALHYMTLALKGPDANTKEMDMLVAPVRGFTMDELMEFSKKADLHLAAVQREPGAEIIVPSVMHWRYGHYSTIIEQEGDRYKIFDNAFPNGCWINKSVIDRQGSGNFLIPAQKISEQWKNLDRFTTENISGTGPTDGPHDPNDGCNNGSGGSGGAGGGGGGGGPRESAGSSIAPSAGAAGGSCSTCGGGTGGGSGGSTGGEGASCSSCRRPGSSDDGGGNGGGGGGGGGYPGNPFSTGTFEAGVGMPVWAVSEPYMNVWLHDTPLRYIPGVGPAISFDLSYKQRESFTPDSFDWEDNIGPSFNCGPNWNFSWRSLVINPYNPTRVVLPNGGERRYTPDGSTPEFFSSTTLTPMPPNPAEATNCIITMPNGSLDKYGYLVHGLQFDSLLLTEMVDPVGHTTRLIYSYDTTNDVTKLDYVVDADGRTNTLSYTNAAFPDRITSVTDPYNRTMHLFYDANGTLSNVVDVAGISSFFAYDGNNWITNLVTPYGTTTFSYTDLGFAGENVNMINRSVMVVDAVGGTNLYLYRDGTGDSPTNPPLSYAYTNQAPVAVPTTTIANINMYYRNSWYWGPKQFANLSTTNMNSFTEADYNKGRLRNWLHDVDMADVSQVLNMERAPSPDGIKQGQLTWYDYDGKTVGGPYGNAYAGSTAQPSLIATVLPDGTDWFRWIRRDQWGHPTNVVETYSVGYGTPVLTRTNQYFYAANGFDLIQIVGPNGETQAGYSYDSNHKVLTATNAAGYVTTYSYDAYERLTGIVSPTGLISTNFYFPSGSYTNWLATNIVVQIGKTNIYGYNNGLLVTRIDERGLAVTNSWDALRRLTGKIYPNGVISNIYVNLDLVETIDRLGYSNLFGYDALRRRVAVTNALRNVTRYNYCSCGALDSIVDMLGNTTQFKYDNAGRLTNTIYADSSSTTNIFDLLGRITNVTDSAGVSVTNYLCNQGIVGLSSNAVGQIYSRLYDNENRVTTNVDNNGVVITNSYDSASRLIARGRPGGGGAETFGYSSLGLTLYTNQLGFTNAYGYDQANRKIAETNANHEVTLFGYDCSGNLTNLTDAKSDTTAWGYDLYGQVTNKVDALGSNILAYAYDADGRLTNRWSIGKTNTFYAYDAVGNLTNVAYQASHSIAMAYDAMNRLTNMVDGVGTSRYTYTEVGALKSEDGPWDADTVSYGYANRRRTSLNLAEPNSSDWVQTYGYDSAGRMQNITSPAGEFDYSYDAGLNSTVAASGLVKKILLPNTAFITNTFDNLARMTSTTLKKSTNRVLNYHGYSYNEANQRTNQVRSALGTNYVNYAYDRTGQVTNDLAYEYAGNAPRMNEQLRYVYDPAGNLHYRTNNTLVQNFEVNSLNELTTSTNGGKLTVVGTTTSIATNVTVNSTSALLYNDATFAATNMTIASTYTAIAMDSKGRKDTNAITVNISTNASYLYDGNGNLTNDGLRSFAYDDENQLVSVWVASAWKSDFTYDGKMRRRIRKEYSWNGSAWQNTNEVRYVYDGNLVIQERDANNLPRVSYTRGKDMTGSLEGAGGIGGLLARTRNGVVENLGAGSIPSHAFYHADGNGNVTMLINSDQIPVAKYEYDSFGNTVSKSGPLADVNLYRFSSKEWHQNSGLIYYLYRYDEPNLQRWINRDLLGEMGFETLRQSVPKNLILYIQPIADLLQGANGFEFVNNQPVSVFDALGLFAPMHPYHGPPPAACPCGQHEEPYWQIAGYSSRSACATAEWDLIRDGIAGGLGSIAGTIIGGTYGGIAGGVLGGMFIPILVCSQTICVN